MDKVIIDNLLEKARSYPKVEGYLRNLDRQRIDEGKDVPVTKREKAVRQADENAALRIESQGKSTDSNFEKGAFKDQYIRSQEAQGKDPLETPGRSDTIRTLDRIAAAEQRFEQVNPGDTTLPDSITANIDKDTIMTRKSIDERTCDLIKNLREGYGREYIKQTGKHFDKEREDQYQAHKRHNERNPNYKPAPEFEESQKKFKEEHAFREKHAKSIDDQTSEYFVKCHSHVLFGETEDSLRSRKKQPKKASGHVLGGGHENEVNHPGGEMVVKKESDAYKSLDETIDDLLEKAKSRSAVGQYDEKVVRALKKEPDVKNPFALATAIKQGTVRHKSEESDFIKGKAWYEGYRGLSKKEKADAKAARKEQMTQQVEKETGKLLPRDYSPSSKSEGSNLIRAIDTVIEKSSMASRSSGNTRITQFSHPFKNVSEVKGKKSGNTLRQYTYDADKQEIEVDKRSRSGKKSDYKDIPTTSAHEKELKNASLHSDIDALLEKAVIGYHARAGKFETGTHKDPKSHGKVSTPALSEERKKQILEGSRKKALTQAEMGGLHGQAAKIRAEKSLDERTSDLAKSLYDIVNRKRFSKVEPEAGIDKKKEEKMDEASKLRSHSLFDAGARKDLEKRSTTLAAVRRGSRKSLDERTCDLNKALTADRNKEIHDAVMTARMIKEDMPEASKMKVKPEDLHRVVMTHNNIAAKRSLKSVVDTWQIESPFITKGVRVMPVGPGGQVQDLSKDEDEDSGAE